jgi:protein SCO1/2
LLLSAAVALVATTAHAAEPLPEELEGVDVDEQLGEMIDLDLTFTDHNGETVALGDLVRGDVPVIFTLNYYSCPMLCGLQLNAVADALKELEWSPGENFRIVTLSFDPDESAELAAAKRQAYLTDLGRGDVDWTFLVGSEENIRALTDSFGYGFRYVEAQGEYAHPAAVMFVSPEGKISRYLYGLMYDPRDVKFALMEAAEGRVGSTMDKLILSCFVYDAEAGSYVKSAFLIMRLGGAATVLALGLFLLILWRRDGTRPSPETV